MQDNERFARIEADIERLEEKMDDLSVIINGPPWDRSLRGRTHELEKSNIGARAAEAALAVAAELRDQRTEHRWSKAERITAIAFGAIIAGGTLVTMTIAIASAVSS